MLDTAMKCPPNGREDPTWTDTRTPRLTATVNNNNSSNNNWQQNYPVQLYRGQLLKVEKVATILYQLELPLSLVEFDKQQIFGNR